MIIFSVLCSRGAILGGVSSEGAYNLSDYYLDQLERATTTDQVSAIGAEMLYTFIQRVQEAKSGQGEAELLRVAKEYIQTHIYEKISLKEMAAEIGYSETHLSRRFKSLSGISLTEMIAMKKIEMAKRIMDDPSSSISISDLAHRLSFSSTSHFCSVFRKIEGMSPVEYKERSVKKADSQA